MKTSNTTSEITKALVKASEKITHAKKDAKNPHFRNDYASLESVIDASHEALRDNGIVVIQAPGNSVLVTRLQHSSGEYFETEVNLLLTKNDMQGLGSAITYARRYSLAALLNMSQADDDGNEASKTPKKAQPKTTTLIHRVPFETDTTVKLPKNVKVSDPADF